MVLHFSDMQCYIIFFSEKGYFGAFVLEFNPLPTHTHTEKNSGMLYTARFKIFSRLRISNIHLLKMTWQILIML